MLSECIGNKDQVNILMNYIKENERRNTVMI